MLRSLMDGLAQSAGMYGFLPPPGFYPDRERGHSMWWWAPSGPSCAPRTVPAPRAAPAPGTAADEIGPDLDDELRALQDGTWESEVQRWLT
jgi:hypothetical protein